MIRNARREDLAAVLEIAADAGLDAALEDLEYSVSAPSRMLLVFQEADGAVSAYAGLSGADGEAELIDIACRGMYKRCGKAEALLGEAGRRLAARSGGPQIALEVREDNAPAIALYEKTGFIRAGRRRRYYPDGTDALVMIWTGGTAG